MIQSRSPWSGHTHDLTDLGFDVCGSERRSKVQGKRPGRVARCVARMGWGGVGGRGRDSSRDSSQPSPFPHKEGEGFGGLIVGGLCVVPSWPASGPDRYGMSYLSHLAGSVPSQPVEVVALCLATCEHPPMVAPPHPKHHTPPCSAKGRVGVPPPCTVRH